MSHVFISHRHEYAKQVAALKSAIQDCSNGKVRVFISEDIDHGKEWRYELEQTLRDASALLLVYGTPEEDWSWCFYEAGYFAAQPRTPDIKGDRRICCIVPPNMPIPGPLSHLQAVTGPDDLIDAIQDIYKAHDVRYDAAELRDAIAGVCHQLFRRLKRYKAQTRVMLSIKDDNLDKLSEIPRGATLSGDAPTFATYFGLRNEQIGWGDIVDSEVDLKDPVDQIFFAKWRQETQEIALKARTGNIQVAQTVLMARNGAQRCRFLLDGANFQPDGSYACEFLLIDEVGGPPGGLSKQELAVLTGIRMGLRFKYELIETFRKLPLELPAAQRRKRVEEIRDTITNLMTEADTRGHFAPEDFFGAFDNADKERLKQLTIHDWPAIKVALDGALGLSDRGEIISKNGLDGPNIKKFRDAIEALRLVNLEFLSRCCQWAAKKVFVSEEQLQINAQQLEAIIARFDDGAGTPPLVPACEPEAAQPALQ